MIQVDEANLTGHPEDAAWAAAPINRVLDAAVGAELVLDAAHPPFGLAVNIPLVDVDENKGAIRLWPGTCSIAKSAAAARCAPVPL